MAPSGLNVLQPETDHMGLWSPSTLSPSSLFGIRHDTALFGYLCLYFWSEIHSAWRILVLEEAWGAGLRVTVVILLVSSLSSMPCSEARQGGHEERPKHLGEGLLSRELGSPDGLGLSGRAQ